MTYILVFIRVPSARTGLLAVPPRIEGVELVDHGKARVDARAAANRLGVAAAGPAVAARARAVEGGTLPVGLRRVLP